MIAVLSWLGMREARRSSAALTSSRRDNPRLEGMPAMWPIIPKMRNAGLLRRSDFDAHPTTVHR